MRYTAAFLVLAISAAASTAHALNCVGPKGHLNWWAAQITAQADFVFLARITDVGSDFAKIRLLKALKSSPPFDHIVEPPLGQGYQFLVGDERVFFTDSMGAVLECSDYSPYASQRVMTRVRRALRSWK
jgi:hypothetical protein